MRRLERLGPRINVGDLGSGLLADRPPERVANPR